MFRESLFALFLLSAFSSSLLPLTTAQDYVLDTDGHAVENHGTYYLLPAKSGSGGGGIEVAATGKESCALTVVQSLNEDSMGLPLKLSSPSITTSHFTEYTSLSIEFTSAPAPCSSASEWTVVKGLPEGRAVKLNDYGNTVEGDFAFVCAKREFYRCNKSYQLIFCPYGLMRCEDVGISIDDDGNRRLVISDGNPFLFKLQKVGSSSST
uniref:Uncharacterized protein n=1 Tax=Glycine max TaxID=3847 RepID=C6SYK2_SOYBN|nr:unknown [Glycine max]